MAIRVTKRTANDGVRYSISGLTFGQIFRIKHAMYEHADRLKGVIKNDLSEDRLLRLRQEFEEFAQDALDVFNAVADGI